MCNSDKIDPQSYLFHPREVAFCGYSGSGKTFLIKQLLAELSQSYAIGYVKHDAHRFEMDIEGKDTFVARQHGARAVLINDFDHWAIIAQGSIPLETLRLIYAPLDMVFVEGYKKSSVPKIVVIDEKELILDAVRRGGIGSVLAYVGIREIHECLDAEYFQRDHTAKIAQHIVARLGLADAAHKGGGS